MGGRSQLLGQVGGLLGKAVGGLAPEAKTAAQGIKAYHGTAHKFAPEAGAPYGRFRDSAIGSGEGVQAYGMGHYLAESEDVARDYRNRLSQGQLEFTTPTGERQKVSSHAVDSAIDPYRLPPPTSYVAQYILDELRRGQSLEKAIELARNDYPQLAPNVVQEAVDTVQAMNPRLTSAGHMYETRIEADRGQFLDWDKRLDEQPNRAELSRILEPDLERMQRGRESLLAKGGTGQGRFFKPLTSEKIAEYQTTPNPTGEAMYNLLRMRTNPVEITDRASVAASRLLRDEGLPGISFLDQHSRYSSPAAIDKLTKELLTVQSFAQNVADPVRRLRYEQQAANLRKKLEAAKVAGPGTSNFVVFDPKIITVVNRYGIVGAVASGLISRELGDELKAAGYPDKPQKGAT